MAKGTFSCPACGENVPAKAKACPHCGACDKTGWKDDAADGLDLPDEDFDYDKFVSEEFGKPQKTKRPALIWKITAVVLLVVTILLITGNLLFRS